MSTQINPENKPTKRLQKKKTDLLKIDENTILNVTDFDVGDVKLSDREKRFVFWYTYPGSNAFQCLSRSAVNAGYSKNSAAIIGYKLKRKSDISAAIKYVLDTKVKIDLDEEYHKIIELKKQRIHYDIGEYVKKVEKQIPIDKEGNTITITVEDLKDLEELTPLQRSVIDGIDYKGMQAVKVYTFADRDKAMADILAMYNKLNGQSDDNDFDVELTTEIIKGNLSVKLAARKNKEKIGKAAGFVQEAENHIEEL